jgi:hypothetical protein
MHPILPTSCLRQPVRSAPCLLAALVLCACGGGGDDSRTSAIVGGMGLQRDAQAPASAPLAALTPAR